MAEFINWECGAVGNNSDSDFEDGWRPRENRGAVRGRGGQLKKFLSLSSPPKIAIVIHIIAMIFILMQKMMAVIAAMWKSKNCLLAQSK